jgi:hypothetical protein
MRGKEAAQYGKSVEDNKEEGAHKVSASSAGFGAIEKRRVELACHRSHTATPLMNSYRGTARNHGLHSASPYFFDIGTIWNKRI